jgi:hypothetical protein
MNPTHAIITAAIHDMNGFADLGQITVEEYETAETAPDPNQADDFCLLLDLWDETGHIADKYVSMDTVASLLGWPVGEIEQRSRQRLAQINDEYRKYLEKSDSAPREPIHQMADGTLKPVREIVGDPRVGVTGEDE